MRFDIRLVFESEDVRERWSVGGALGAWLHSSAVDFIPTPSPAMYTGRHPQTGGRVDDVHSMGECLHTVLAFNGLLIAA